MSHTMSEPEVIQLQEEVLANLEEPSDVFSLMFEQIAPELTTVSELNSFLTDLMKTMDQLLVKIPALRLSHFKRSSMLKKIKDALKKSFSPSIAEELIEMERRSNEACLSISSIVEPYLSTLSTSVATSFHTQEMQRWSAWQPCENEAEAESWFSLTSPQKVPTTMSSTAATIPATAVNVFELADGELSSANLVDNLFATAPASSRTNTSNGSGYIACKVLESMDCKTCGSSIDLYISTVWTCLKCAILCSPLMK